MCTWVQALEALDAPGECVIGHSIWSREENRVLCTSSTCSQPPRPSSRSVLEFSGHILHLLYPKLQQDTVMKQLLTHIHFQTVTWHNFHTTSATCTRVMKHVMRDSHGLTQWSPLNSLPTTVCAYPSWHSSHQLMVCLPLLPETTRIQPFKPSMIAPPKHKWALSQRRVFTICSYRFYLVNGKTYIEQNFNYFNSVLVPNYGIRGTNMWSVTQCLYRAPQHTK